jgi:hypothetical protein
LNPDFSREKIINLYSFYEKHSILVINDIQLIRKKGNSFYFDLRLYVMVIKATATKTKATPIADTLENSGTDGVGSVVPDGANTVW